jgi:hypothetical protein
MKLTKLAPQILLFEGYTQKELALTFFRIQEYYESPLNGLRNQQFSVFDFLYESMDVDGSMNYFTFWAGFNFPGFVVKDWWNKHSDWTPFEQRLIRDIRLNVDTDEPFYVIGALEKDTETIDHEVAHALWFIDQDYQKEMSELNTELIMWHSDNYEEMQNHLLSIGYSDVVMSDEIQAYMIESQESFLEEFDVNYSEVEDIRKKYREVFEKYKNKHKIA